MSIVIGEETIKETMQDALPAYSPETSSAVEMRFSDDVREMGEARVLVASSRAVHSVETIALAILRSNFGGFGLARIIDDNAAKSLDVRYPCKPGEDVHFKANGTFHEGQVTKIISASGSGTYTVESSSSPGSEWNVSGSDAFQHVTDDPDSDQLACSELQSAYDAAQAVKKMVVVSKKECGFANDALNELRDQSLRWPPPPGRTAMRFTSSTKA